MSPNRLAPALLLAAIAGLSIHAHAEEAQAGATRADPSIAPLLDELGYEYEVDADGDYKLIMAIDDSERTQLVFVRSPVESYGSYRVREVWSPAYRAAGAAFPGPVANRLLEASHELKLGSWVKNDGHALLVIKLDAEASADALQQAITAAVTSADEMEQDLAGDPASDEF